MKPEITAKVDQAIQKLGELENAIIESGTPSAEVEAALNATKAAVQEIGSEDEAEAEAEAESEPEGEIPAPEPNASPVEE
jgi:hypothetical protein